jgi:hypothetical protein
MNGNVVITTRTQNTHLYDIAMDLITLPYTKIPLYNQTANGYFYRLCELDADWVINIDEDAFVWDNEELDGLVHYMQDNEFDFCGMPDGGVVVTRGANPIVMNAFFNVFNLRKIKQHLVLQRRDTNLRLINRVTSSISKALDVLNSRSKVTSKPLRWISHRQREVIFERSRREIRRQVEEVVLLAEWKRFTPEALMKGKFEYVTYEPYYAFFYWLLQSGFKPLYLDAETWEDGLSTILHSHRGTPFMIHCWYARDYNKQKDRFLSAINCRPS